MEIKGDGNILPQSNIKDVITDNFMHDVIDASKGKKRRGRPKNKK